MNKKNQFSQTKNIPIKDRRKDRSAKPDDDLDFHYDELVNLLIQLKEGCQDPFWDRAIRTALKAALKKQAVESVHDVEKLYTFLKSASNEEFENFFEGTNAVPYTSSRSSVSSAIRTLLMSYIADFLAAYARLSPAITPVPGARAGVSPIDPEIPLTASDEKNSSAPFKPRRKKHGQ